MRTAVSRKIERKGRAWRRMASGAGALALCLLLGPAGASIAPSPQSERPPLEDALLFLGQVGLSRANPGGVAVAAGVRRWHEPVTVTLEGLEVRGFRAMLQERLDRLRDWTGLPFTLTQSPGPGNNRLTIVIRPYREHAARFGRLGAACLTTTEGEGGRLFRARIEISERHLDCLDHELMHALGFENHWDGGAERRVPSVLSPRHSTDRQASFSDWDVLAIRALYDSALTPGLARPAALARSRPVLARLLADAAGD